MIAAVLPIPPRPEFPELTEEDTRKSRLDLQEEMNRIWSPVDEKRYQNARWWRILNRIFSVVGVAIITLIVRIFPACFGFNCLTETDRTSRDEGLRGEKDVAGTDFPDHIITYVPFITIYSTSTAAALPAVSVSLPSPTTNWVAHSLQTAIQCQTTRLRPHTPFIFMVLRQAFMLKISRTANAAKLFNFLHDNSINGRERRSLFSLFILLPTKTSFLGLGPYEILWMRNRFYVFTIHTLRHFHFSVSIL